MSNNVNSSKLSELVVVERKTLKQDKDGNPVWEEYYKGYAYVIDRAGGEALISSQNKRVSTAKTMFTFRSSVISANILPTMRIVWRGLVHEILTPTIFSSDRNYVTVETVRQY